MKNPTCVLILGLAVVFGGCGLSGDSVDSTQPGSAVAEGVGDSAYGDGYASYYGAGEIKFLNDVQSNVDLARSGAAAISFVDLDGNDAPLETFYRDRDVVLVITRGNTNPICPYCSTQTANLISSYQSFLDRSAEVVLVYPIEAMADQPRLDAFLEDARNRLSDSSQPVPFPVLIDPGLAGVERLGIRADLARPAAYIVDRDGNVRFGYVGADVSDRPSVELLLAQLDELHPEEAGPPVVPDIGPVLDSSDDESVSE